ncbi:hypothetical protein SAMN02982929_03162 [Saccharopolyspora kobensis]|uniref:Uncharacterized protein n=1 Tax=Saccharopolyspora kobensis TaxID=146035 RepID=A0A1H6C651_9PSEU|nr:hypothetical protein [Saccharopolyspora kobensis]SEG68451.1 hypothetical protein SAMN02982929_03162 [Saccharopolyspora kobensis]SFC29910.1 hypothetical protein SAMN05216506_101402 [Saccharopolyspora kobensis]
MEWSEDEYVDYLRGERTQYAWVMRHYGGTTAEQAEAAAAQRYPYEPADKPYRGLVFHDEAWHWAMLALHGEQYWARHPELVDPPAAYRELG